MTEQEPGGTTEESHAVLRRRVLQQAIADFGTDFNDPVQAYAIAEDFVASFEHAPDQEPEPNAA